MRILSLGAGVQSSTLLLMACRGDIDLDCAIFADTQWEPREVYDWLEQVLQPEADKAGIPIYRVTAGDIRLDALDHEHGFASMPVFVETPDREGMVRRQCTREYKIAPIRRQIKELTKGIILQPVTLLIGISLDEVHRLRDSQVKYIKHEYPLVFDLQMRRSDCKNWVEAKGYPQPPRSACIGCPFHNDQEWRHLRDDAPDEWQDAVDFDSAIRNGGYVRLNSEAYLHRQLKPLDQVTLKHEDQVDLWGNECEGMCGL